VCLGLQSGGLCLLLRLRLRLACTHSSAWWALNWFEEVRTTLFETTVSWSEWVDLVGETQPDFWAVVAL
jgi:hypothetical protein